VSECVYIKVSELFVNKIVKLNLGFKALIN
jgi:hypothetical protein